jgi:hypothetical protein
MSGRGRSASFKTANYASNANNFSSARGSPVASRSPSPVRPSKSAIKSAKKKAKVAAAVAVKPAAAAAAATFASVENNGEEFVKVLTKEQKRAAARAEAEAAEAERKEKAAAASAAAEAKRKAEAVQKAEEQRKAAEEAEKEANRKAEEARKAELEAARKAEEARKAKLEADRQEAARKAREEARRKLAEVEAAAKAAREEVERKAAAQREAERKEKEAFEARLAAEKAAKEAEERRKAIEAARQVRKTARHARKTAASRKAASPAKSPSKSPPKRISPGPNLGTNRPLTIAQMNLLRQYNASKPFMQAIEVQYFTLIVATEIFKMLYSNSLIDFMVAHVKSANVKKLLKSHPNNVYRFYLKGGGATAIIQRLMLKPDNNDLFEFTNDLDFTFLVNPSLPVADFRKIRAIAVAAVLDAITNIAGKFNEDVPHILRPKDLRRLNGIFYDFNWPIVYEIQARGATLLEDKPPFDRVEATVLSTTQDDEVMIYDDYSLWSYLQFIQRPLGNTKKLSVQVYMNPSVKLKSLKTTVITLATRSDPRFTFLDIAFPTSDNDKIDFEWDLSTADTRLFKAPINYRGYKGNVQFPVIGPVSNFVDQKYSALPFTESRAEKVTSREGRAATLAQNILIPRAANLAKTIKKVSQIRFKNQTPNGKNITRKAGNLLSEAMGAAYPA